MALQTIKPPRVEAEARSGAEEISVVSGAHKLTAGEMPEFGGSGRYITPLELYLAALATCDIITFKLVAAKAGFRGDYSIKISAEGGFQIGEGPVEVKLRVVIRGMPRDVAENVWSHVKKNCPIYATAVKSGARIEDEVVVE